MHHYNAVGLMSGSSLDGLDIAFVRLSVADGHWTYDWIATDCVPYTGEWRSRLEGARHLSVPQFLELHTSYGALLGATVNTFLNRTGYTYQPDFIASHGHTAYHNPALRTSTQIGDGAAIAAATGLPVVSDLRNMDVALGGQGAPIVPIGDRLLFGEFDYLLNLGGIANISIRANGSYSAFDICPCNQLLDYYARAAGFAYDEHGALSAAGTFDDDVMRRLEALPFYQQPAPKSLANEFSRAAVLPLIDAAGLPVQDSLATAITHIAGQIALSLKNCSGGQLLATGGGAHNRYLITQLSKTLASRNIEIVVPEPQLINFKEALVMALIGALRWRTETNVYASVTGALRNSIGGAIWAGKA